MKKIIVLGFLLCGMAVLNGCCPLSCLISKKKDAGQDQSTKPSSQGQTSYGKDKSQKSQP